MDFKDTIKNPGFVTKDSGKREEFSTGMRRDTQDDKPRYDLLDLPMLKRWAELMARGAKKYGEHNWKKAATEVELDRFKASLLRHVFQYLEGDITEDHGAAIFFNVAGAEMVKEKLLREHKEPELAEICPEKPCCGDCDPRDGCVCEAGPEGCL